MKHSKSILRKNHKGNRYSYLYKPTYNVYQPTYNNGSHSKSNNKNIIDVQKGLESQEKPSKIPSDWIWQLFIALLSALSPVIIGGIIKLLMAYLC